MNTKFPSSSIKKPVLNRINPIKSNPITNDKPSKLAGNTIVYNTSTPKIRISNKPKEYSNTNQIDLNFNYEENKDYSGIRQNKNLNDFMNVNMNNISDTLELEKLRKELAIANKKLIEKEKLIIGKDKIIKDLKDKNEKLNKENTLMKSKVTSQNRTNRNSHNDININNNIPRENKDDIELAMALNQINEMERRNNNNPFGMNIHHDDIIDMTNSFLPNFAQMFLNINQPEEIDPIREYENQLLNEICPNPDNMTYEQLLELGEKVGHVDRGFTKSQIDKIPTIIFSRHLHKNLDKCTVCQFEIKEREILRKLTCGHVYHTDCIDEWLLQDKKCPVCKFEVRLK